MLARIAARLSRSSLSPASRLGQRTHVPSRTALTLASCNEKVRAASYAVRGELVLRADKYQRQLAQSGGQGHGLPFDSIIYCNIGNPHAVGSLPMTYFRQVMALVDCPPLLRQVEQAQADAPASDVAALFPRDVVARARQYSDAIPGGTGAYTNSQGLDIVRQEVAAYITERDGTNGIPAASADDVFLTDGASPGVKMLAQLMLRDQSDGLMIPIPQYPLYSATVAVCGGTQLGYYLDEATNWSLDLNELQRTHDDALSRGVSPRGLTIINPGNPTGQCLPEDNIRDVIRFCEANELLIMADEVYQTNIYAQTPFTSFRKALLELGGETAKKVQLVSFHSTSKGFVGECGRRGGYFELINIDEDVKMELYKLASINLCSNVNGQVMTGLMTRPPQQGEESFELYEQERVGALEGLSRRAGVLVEGLNKLEGVSCQIVEGAMYAFPTVTLPEGAIEAAKQQGKAADVFYCLELLDATGVCVVPGSGFGQRDNTFHFRTTILPLQIEEVVERVSRFHTEFMAKYA